MRGLGVSLLVIALFCHVAVNGHSMVPDYLASEEADDDLYSRMFPEQDILVSRRREDPVTDEQYWLDEDVPTADDDTIVASTLGVIDSSKLPPNYHNTTSVTKKINGQVVTINTTITKKTDPKTGRSSLSVVRTVNSGGTPMKKCKSSSTCGTGQYCENIFFGDRYCTNCTSLGETCNSDAQCCGNGTKNALCVGGTCQNGFTKGQAGTLCDKATRCNTGLCCARHFMGASQCRRLATLGQRCTTGRSEFSSLMDGGLCPCISGLVCTSSNSWFSGFMRDFPGDTTCQAREKSRAHGNYLSSLLNDMPFEDDDDDFQINEVY